MRHDVQGLFDDLGSKMIKSEGDCISSGCCNYYKLGSLNHRNLFLVVPDTWEVQDQVPADLVSGESFLPGLQITTFSYLHVTWGETSQALVSF